jgi:hypothetical protein
MIRKDFWQKIYENRYHIKEALRQTRKLLNELKEIFREQGIDIDVEIKKMKEYMASQPSRGG